MLSQKSFKRIISLLCVVMMFFSAIPILVSAEDAADNKCLQIVTGVNQWEGINITAANLGLELGNTYDFSMRVFAPDIAVGVVAQTATYSWVMNAGAGSFNQADKQWKTLSGSLTILADGTLTDYNISIVKMGDGGNLDSEIATFYIDDFTVKERESGTVVFNETFDGATNKFSRGSSTITVVADPELPAVEPEPTEGNHVYKIKTGVMQWDGTSTPAANFGLQLGGVYEFSLKVFTPDMDCGILIQHSDIWTHVINTRFDTPEEQEWREVSGVLDTSLFEKLHNIQITKDGGSPNYEEEVTFYIDDFTIVDINTSEVVFSDDFEGKTSKITGGGATVKIVPETEIYEIPVEEPVTGEYALDVAPLKDIYEDYFLMGSIVNPSDFGNGAGARERYSIFKHHYNAITFENSMKPDAMWGNGNSYDVPTNPPNFSVDPYISTMMNDGIEIIGHTLSWHGQSPNWLNVASGNRENSTVSFKTYEEAKANLKLFIEAIAGHYYNNPDGLEIYSWDVLNEAIDFWGSDSQIIRDGITWQEKATGAVGWMSPLYGAYANGGVGSDYVYDVFLFAREADPNAILYYNDYNMQNPGKATLVMNMVNDVNARYAAEHPEANGRLLIEGIGMQEHQSITTSVAEVEASIQKFISTGCVISITELDIGVPGYQKGDTLSEADEIKQGLAFARMFNLFKKYSDNIERVTFWGMDDAHSWRPNDLCLVFDGKYRTKLAYDAIANPDLFLEKHDPSPLVIPTDSLEGTASYGTPVIGGDVEDELWSIAEALPVTRHLNIRYGAEGVSKVLWDVDNLYVQIKVEDKVINNANANEWEQDSVEIFFDEYNSKSVVYVDGMGQYRINYENLQSFNLGGVTSNDGFVSYAKLTSDGYMIEMQIPFQFHTPKTGDMIGFDTQINDADAKGARQDVIMWSDTTGISYTDGSKWGTLELICVHDYATTTIDPTYETEGYDLHVCNLCGDSYTDNEVGILEIVVDIAGIGSIIDYDSIQDGLVKVRLDQSIVTAIGNAQSSKIEIDLNVLFNDLGVTEVDLSVLASLFKNVDKTLTFIVDGNRFEVKTKNIFNNSGKDRIISVTSKGVSVKNK